MTTFIDTNVLIDVLADDPTRRDPCAAKLDEAKARGRVLISDIVFSEFSVTMETLQEAEQVINSLDITRVRCSAEGLFAAGKAFKAYRDSTPGQKNNVLPDLIIGAHASSEVVPLVTSDVKRMTTYFPGLEVIKP